MSENTPPTRSGPLVGIKIIEFAGQGPGPFAGMMFSDLGADVLRIDRKGSPMPQPWEVDRRGRHRIELDLKSPANVELCLDLVAEADVVIEGHRPGVMERLGLGEEALFARNPALVFGRITGWGQSGPLAHAAGHDLNYLALSGALSAIGTPDKVVPPLNLVADYGGGAMFLITGVLAALLHARETGLGQVVDAAMVDGAAYLASIFYGFHSTGAWTDQRSANMLDGGAPYYDTYVCADGKWIAIGALEPQFYALLVDKCGLEAAHITNREDKNCWGTLRTEFAELFRSKTRDEWCELLEGTDACFAPVLSLGEAPNHPHNVARSAFIKSDNITLPAPAPRFSLTPQSTDWANRQSPDSASSLANWRASPRRASEINQHSNRQPDC